MIGKIINLQQNIITIKLESIPNFRHDVVNVSEKKQYRTIPQNNFLWAYYTYCFYKGLRDHGHFSITGFHEDVKAWLKREHPEFAKRGFSTSDLTKSQFSEMVELINQGIMIEYFNIDTSDFFAEYERFKEWQKYNNGTFADYLREKKN